MYWFANEKEKHYTLENNSMRPKSKILVEQKEKKIDRQNKIWVLDSHLKNQQQVIQSEIHTYIYKSERKKI